MPMLVQSHCQGNDRHHQRAEQDGDGATVIQGVLDDVVTGRQTYRRLDASG